MTWQSGFRYSDYVGVASVASLGKAVRSPVMAKPRSAIANDEPGFAWRSREQGQVRSEATLAEPHLRMM